MCISWLLVIMKLGVLVVSWLLAIVEANESSVFEKILEKLSYQAMRLKVPKLKCAALKYRNQSSQIWQPTTKRGGTNNR